MKRIYTLLTMLLLVCVGAQADVSSIGIGSSESIKSNGIFYKNGEVISTSAWCDQVVIGPITLAGSISSFNGRFEVVNNGVPTLTISVPDGQTISSYTLGAKICPTGTSTCTAAAGGEGITLNTANYTTISASGVNSQTATINFTGTGDNNGECIIEISDFVVDIEGYDGSAYKLTDYTHVINAANGQFYSGNTIKTWTSGDLLYANKWLSTETTPQMTLYTGTSTVGGGSNNIVLDAAFRIHTDTYTITVPEAMRYRIKGYIITAYTGYTSNISTITPQGQTARKISTDPSKPTTIFVDGLSATSAVFTVSTGKPWINITSFKVAYDDLISVTNNTLDELAKIPSYSTVATSTKSSVASLHNLADIQTTVNEALDINVAFGNCNTSNPIRYLATTGTNVTGSIFSTDAAWKLTNYNATEGTFNIYNAAHETYVGPLPSEYNTAAIATTNAENAGRYTITGTTAGDAGGAGKIIFHRPDFNGSYDCIHYQTANSIAVRWGASATASQWDVNNVYSLSYGHYKITDVENPSTEGATLFASSKDYYLSGTSIEYADPLDALSPVTSLNSKPTDGAITSDVVVNYYYEQDATLPFTTSTISGGVLDNPTWYYIKINDLAVYPSGDRMVVDGSSTGMHYERWCFVGDAINGVQIYAESKGVAYPLNISSMANNDNVRISSTSTNTRWFVEGSTLSNLKFYQKSGSNSFYLNQLGGVGGGSSWYWRVGLWSSGSNIVLSPADTDLPEGWALESINTITADVAFVNANTLGYPTNAARTPLQTALTNFGISSSYTNYTSMLSAYETYLATTDIVKPSKGFYRIKSSASWASAPNKYLVGVNSTKYTERAAYDGEAGNSALSIWYYDGTYLTNYGNGGYKAVSSDNKLKNSTTVSEGTRVSFERASGKNEWQAFNIKFNTNRYLYTKSTTEDDVTYYYTDSGTSINSEYGYVFNVEPVTELPITVNQVGDKYYATLYMPIPVSISGSTAYTLAFTDDGQWLTPTAVDGNVPAEQPVVLVGTSGTVTANVQSTAGEQIDSPLSGTLAAKTVAAETDYFLGMFEGNVGFYKWAGTTLKGFRAYLPAGELPAAARGFAINWDDEVTGIGDATQLKQKAESRKQVFDLQGRRVENPQRGLYIVNGRKVVVK